MMASPVFISYNTSNSMPNNSFLSKYQVAMPTAVEAMASPEGPNDLPSNYQVRPNDVVCGRGKGSYNRPGNKAFRTLVQEHVHAYTHAKTKLDKSMVLSAIVERVHENGGGRFIKQRKGGEWHEISDEQAREKVGHAIREAIATGEKKAQHGSSSSAPTSPQNQGETPTDFQSKQNDLLSAQLSIFEEFLAQSRSNSPAEDASPSVPQPPSLTRDFPW